MWNQLLQRLSLPGSNTCSYGLLTSKPDPPLNEVLWPGSSSECKTGTCGYTQRKCLTGDNTDMTAELVLLLSIQKPPVLTLSGPAGADVFSHLEC